MAMFNEILQFICMFKRNEIYIYIFGLKKICRHLDDVE